MNELQKKELELLKIFIEICEKLGLKYYLVCGSALGAVKYGGFIPWDDDLDVGLCRDDYEVFIKEAQKYLPEHIFLQNWKTDPQFPSIYSKLRDSNTTYIEKSVASLDINHGVYIDVFPLDGYPTEKTQQKLIEKSKYRFKLKQMCCFQGSNSAKVRVYCGFMRLFGVHKRIRKSIEHLEKRISCYSVKDSEIWCNHGNWQGSLEYAPRKHYGNGAMVDFEGIAVRVPEKYDDYLTQKYGDWRADLPESEKQGHHYYSVMDLEKPYTEYIK